MFFSKDKKTSNSRILTEAEIKRKLYGEYETTSEAVHASHEVKMSGSSFATGIREEAAQPRAAVRPAVAAPRNEDAAVRSSAVASTGHPFRKAAPAIKAGGAEWKKTALQIGGSIGGFLASILFKIGGYLVKSLDFLLRLLDPRKPQARRLLYSITACVLVAALFWGVFRLNAQRKMAMSGELKSAPAAAVPAAVQSEPAPAADNENIESSSADAAAPAADSQREESQEMILKALENSESSSAVQPTAPAEGAPAISSGKFVIQVATYALLQDANRIIQSMKDAGFSAFYKKQTRSSTGHSFYPVYLGRFESYSAAQQELSKFRKNAVARPFQDAFVRTLEL